MFSSEKPYSTWQLSPVVYLVVVVVVFKCPVALYLQGEARVSFASISRVCYQSCGGGEVGCPMSSPASEMESFCQGCCSRDSELDGTTDWVTPWSLHLRVL